MFESSNNFKELREKAEKPGPEQSESKKQLEEILKLHIVENDITSEKILNESRNKVMKLELVSCSFQVLIFLLFLQDTPI